MNISVGHLAYILLASSLVGAVSDTAGKRSIWESIVPGINIPPSGIDLSSGIAVQVPPQQIAVQVPHPVAVPVPHPIVVPVPVDRPVPYPVPIIKKYFIPVSFNAANGQAVPVPTSAKRDGNGDESGSDFAGGSEITAETLRIYTGHISNNIASGNSSSTTNVTASFLPETKSVKRNSSFKIHVNET